MNYEWDDDKAEKNLTKHGVDFERIFIFEWEDAVVLEDDRQDYGEPRYTALGFIGDRIHVLTFTERGKTCRVISLRKANKRERKFYATQT